MRRIMKGLALLALCVSQSWASQVTFDFNSDPFTGGLVTKYGTSTWVPYDGVGYQTNANDGYLQVTEAMQSQGGALVFADFDNGAVVQGFTFEADLRIGGGTADPADGFSINYARADDPCIAAGDVWAPSPDCTEASLPEEGTRTGLAIGFDAWKSGTTSGCSQDGPDIIGISVRIDNTLVKQFAMPTKNGQPTDATSLQTGPNSSELTWQPLKVDLSTANVLNIWWKGKQILTNYQVVGYFPSPGRLIFGGRTGGSYQKQEVDNIRIKTTAAALALVGTITGHPDGFTFTITDGASSVVNGSTITAKLDGTTVTPLTVTKVGNTTTVVYRGFPTMLVSGSTHSLDISAKDMNNNPITATRSFTAPTYGTVAATEAVTGVDTTKPGFKIAAWQSAGQPNRIYWTEEQLLGLHGDNTITTAPVDFTGVVNFNCFPLSAGGAGYGDAGSFTTANGYPDSFFPGIIDPALGGLTGSTAIEALTFLKFSAAGLYTMCVNSDDGFLVTAGKNPKDRFAAELGVFDGGKGASDVTFTVAVMAPGIYPFRLIWENGNGEGTGNGANCEWFTIKDGVKYLINDPADTVTGISAYYAGPALPAYVSHLYPYENATGARPDKLVAQLTDGATTVNGSSIQFSIDGTPVSATISKSGPVTTAAADLTAANMMLPGKRTVTLAWSDSAATAHTGTWSFTVDSYVTLDPALSVPLSAADSTKPGFTLQVTQIDPDITRPGDGMANQIDSANAAMAGLYFPWYGTNTADLVTGGWSGLLPAYSNVWYWNEPMDFANVGSEGDFTYNKYFPGLPGVGPSLDQENFVAWIDGYVALNAGFYKMGISSDDGFRVTEGIGITRQVLHVTGSGVDRDVAAVASTKLDGNPGFGGPLPKTPITAPVQYMPAVPAAGCPGFPYINLTGKIAVINNENCYDADLVYQAQQYGAVAVILVNDDQWGMPYVLTGTPGGTVTVPVLCVNSFGGEEDMWITNTTLQATIGADANLQLGSADYGKGMGWVDFGIVVPQTGLYPLHVTFEQGGGGAGMEWAVQYSDSLAWDARSRTLVNDSAEARSLKAYRAVTQLPTPTMSVAKVVGAYKITYTGVLKASATVNGTYQAVTGASSPYTIPTTGASMFYRAYRN